MGILQAFFLVFESTWMQFLKRHSLLIRFEEIFKEVTAFKSFDNPSLCHGVSGRLDFLMMSPVLTSNAAISQVYLLEMMKVPVGESSREGRLAGQDPHLRAWTSDFTTITTPDLWVGFLGPALVLEKWKRGESASVISHTFWRQLANLNREGPAVVELDLIRLKRNIKSVE